jgi:hypothetical protein
VALGDVIVADRVYSFDHGKLVATPAATGEELADFDHDIKTYNLERAWQMDAAAFRGDLGWAAHLLPSRPRTKDAQRRWLLHALYAHEHEHGPEPRAHAEHAAVFRIDAPGATDWADRILELRRQGLLAPGPAVLKLTPAGRLEVEEDRLLYPRGAPPEPPLRVHVGPIATGNAVIEDPRVFGWLQRIGRKTIGLEMEAYAIGHVGDTLPRRAIVAKAVSDHADGDKDDRFRAFACRASAAWLFAFLRRHLAPRATAPEGLEPASEIAAKAAPAPEDPAEPRATPGLGPVFPDEDPRRVTALQRDVERALARRHPGARTIWKHGPERAPRPLRTFLELHRPGGGYDEISPVAVVEGDVGKLVLESFVKQIASRYRDYIPYLRVSLIHTGSVPAGVAEDATRSGVHLESVLELLGYLDFRPYVEQQTWLLAADADAGPAPLEPRRLTYRIGHHEHERRDALEVLDTWLSREGPQRLLLLGDPGVGKTTLLRRLALRLGGRRHVTAPVLVDLRDLEKARGLDALLGQHFAQHGLRRFDHGAFREMLEKGHVVLLFDGFDELAARVTADAAAAHAGTLLQAAVGDAKIVIASRAELGERVVRCGFRTARLLR